MTFKSKAQRRKFYALKAEGKMDQKTIDEWEKDTPKNLPEKVASNRRALMRALRDAQAQYLQEDPELEDTRKYLKGRFHKMREINKLASLGVIALVKEASMGKELIEAGGLGILAVPSIQKLRGKPMKEDTAAKMEIAGLGTLAAPSIYNIGKMIAKK